MSHVLCTREREREREREHIADYKKAKSKKKKKKNPSLFRRLCFVSTPHTSLTRYLFVYKQKDSPLLRFLF